MRLAPYIEALQHDLAKVATGSDERTAEIVGRLASALEASLRLRLLEAVSEAARELSAQLPGVRVEVRLDGTDPTLSLADQSGAPPSDETGDYTARISLRLRPALKARIEAAASRESLSVNSWVVAALTDAAEERQRRIGKRLTGFARS